MLTNAAARDTSFWSEFSELEMDRVDDVYILSRSMTEISADVNEVLSQMGGFIGGASEGEYRPNSPNSLTICRTKSRCGMVAHWHAVFAIVGAVRDAAKSTGKQVELDLSRQRNELDNNIHSADF